MNRNSIFIYLAAYSPRYNIIASLRAQKIAKYISDELETYIVAGIPKLDEKTKHKSNYLNTNIDINKAKLIEIPTVNKKHTFNKIKERNSVLKKKLKIELLPFLETMLPISPGGMLYHNKKKYFSEIENIIKNNYDRRNIYLFASYGPAFILKIAKKIKKTYPKVYLIEDFRDWAYKYYEGWFYNTFFFKNFTKDLLRGADLVTFVSKTMKKEYCDYFGLDINNVLYLPNGYDPADYCDQEFSIKKLNMNYGKFRIVYTGSFHEKNRNPKPILEALKKLSNDSKDVLNGIKFVYAGKDEAYIKQYFAKYKLLSIFTSKGFLSRKESLKLQHSADILLLLAYTGQNCIIGSSIITGKIYEYLKTNAPIICLAPNKWELKKILEADGISKVIPANETNLITNYLSCLFKDRTNKTIDIAKREEVISQFSYKNITNKLLRKIINTNDRESLI